MSPIYVALDTPNLEQALGLAIEVRDLAGGLKLGLEFFAANGPTGVMRIAKLGLPIFLDLKLHDIPHTVAKAIAALRPLEPAVLTVHAAGGRAMLEAARSAAPAKTKVVAVTVLTSLDGDDLHAIGVSKEPKDQVTRLAHIARNAGLDGVVCSGNEVDDARAAWPGGFFVVPGVRPEGSVIADQKRVVTPREALDAGASLIVIGRPITGAESPAAALRQIVETL